MKRDQQDWELCQQYEHFVAKKREAEEEMDLLDKKCKFILHERLIEDIHLHPDVPNHTGQRLVKVVCGALDDIEFTFENGVVMKLGLYPYRYFVVNGIEYFVPQSATTYKNRKKDVKEIIMKLLPFANFVENYRYDFKPDKLSRRVDETLKKKKV